jgi:hypothetical protein
MLLLLSLGFTTKQLLGDFWLTDPLSVFVIVLAIFCIVTRRDLAYALVLAIGVGVREDVLLVAPLYYTLNAERVVDLRLAARTVLLTLPALAVFFGLRHFITPLNHDPAYLKSLPLDQRVVYGGGGKYYTSFNYVDIIRESIVHPLFAAQRMLPHLVFVLRSMVILLPFLAFVRSWKAIVRFAPFVLLLFAQLFFIDTNRYVTAAFVIFTLWALFGVSDLSRRLEIPAIVFAGLPLLFIALNLLSVSQIDAPTPVQVAVLAAYAAGIGLITLRRRPPSTARSAAV